MSWRKWVVVMGVLALLVVFVVPVLAQEKTENISAPGTPLPQPRVIKGTPHVAYAVVDLSSESCQRDWLQAQLEHKRRGWKLTAVTDANTPDKERNALKVLIDKNVDAIVITYWIMEPLRDLIIEARKKGIGIYCVDTELKPGVLVDTTQPNGVVGATMAYYIIDHLEGKGSVAVLNYQGHILRQRCYAARALFESKIDWPALNMVAWQDLGVPGYEKQSYDITASWLLKYGKKLNAIFAGWDIPGVFAAKAALAGGYTRKDLIITGIDGGSLAYDMIRTGSPFTATMSQPFEEYVYNTYEVVKNMQVDGKGIGEKGCMVPNHRNVYSVPVLTTPENLPPIGTNIHEVFKATYYDPSKKDAWYMYGEPYKITHELVTK